MEASQPIGRPALQERVAAAILEAAASVLAARGEGGSMTDVAEAAGVARATVYRYFPNRQALLDELAELAIRSAGESLASARIEQVPVEEALTRAVRALVGVGDLLIERGQQAGEIRDDIPSTWLTDSLVGTVVSILSSSPALGREDTVAAIASLFSDGVRAETSGA
jgi:AcrR family transcriptional regulator